MNLANLTHQTERRLGTANLSIEPCCDSAVSREAEAVTECSGNEISCEAAQRGKLSAKVAEVARTRDSTSRHHRRVEHCQVYGLILNVSHDFTT